MFTTVKNSKRPRRFSVEETCSLIRRSSIVSRTLSIFKEMPSFTHIECIALGSPTNEANAGYQLCYVILLAEACGIPHSSVRLYDPVFSDSDKCLLRDELHFSISSVSSQESPDHTLHLLPHAVIDLIDSYLKQERPRYLVTNDLSQYLFKWNQGELYSAYPHVAMLQNLCEGPCPKQDDFKLVTRKARQPEAPPVYDYASCYFSTANHWNLQGAVSSEMYDYAFSNLCFYALMV